MKKYLTGASILLFVVTLAGMLFCTSTNYAGDVTETGNATVTGKVVDTSGIPIGNALVRLRKIDFVTPTPSLTKTLIFGANAETDSFGHFELKGVDPGFYRIEITNGHVAVQTTCLLEANKTKHLGANILEPFATVIGSVDTSGHTNKRLCLQIKGLERLVSITPAGSFSVSDLPAGVYSVRVVSTNDTTPIVKSDSVVAQSGTTTLLPMVGWRFSKRLSINTTASGAGISENVTGFPLLVRLDSAAFGSASTPLSDRAQSATVFFSQAQESGQDLRFTKSDNTPLPYEIDLWDKIGKKAAIWVYLDTVYGNSAKQFITMYWGTSASTQLSNGANVFDTANGFVGVWHLGALGRQDACGRYPGTAFNYDGDESVTGMIGKADSIADDDYLDLGNLNVQNNLTLEAWVKITEPNNWFGLVNKSTDSAQYPWEVFGLMLDSAQGPKAFRFAISINSQMFACSSTTVAQNEIWYHVCGVRNDMLMKIFINGTLEDVRAIPTGSSTTDRHVLLGCKEFFPENTRSFTIDEMRISRVARSAAWMKLSYENQKDHQRLIVP